MQGNYNKDLLTAKILSKFKILIMCEHTNGSKAPT